MDFEGTPEWQNGGMDVTCWFNLGNGGGGGLGSTRCRMQSALRLGSSGGSACRLLMHQNHCPRCCCIVR